MPSGLGTRDSKSAGPLFLVIPSDCICCLYPGLELLSHTL